MARRARARPARAAHGGAEHGLPQSAARVRAGDAARGAGHCRAAPAARRRRRRARSGARAAPRRALRGLRRGGVLCATALPVAGGPAMLLGAEAAIDLRAALLREAQAAWRRTRARRRRRGGRAAKALALCTLGQCYSAWNERKRLLLAADDGRRRCAPSSRWALVLRVSEGDEALRTGAGCCRAGGGARRRRSSRRMWRSPAGADAQGGNYHAGRTCGVGELLLPLVAEEARGRLSGCTATCAL